MELLRLLCLTARTPVPSRRPRPAIKNPWTSLDLGGKINNTRSQRGEEGENCRRGIKLVFVGAVGGAHIPLSYRHGERQSLEREFDRRRRCTLACTPPFFAFKNSASLAALCETYAHKHGRPLKVACEV